MGDNLREVREQLQSRLRDLQDGYFEEEAGKTEPNTDIKKRRELRGHFQKVYAIHWAGRTSDLLLSASQDGKLIVWNANTTNKLNAVPLKSPWVMSCAFEQKQNQLVASGGLDNVCTVYRIGGESINTMLEPERELEAHLGYISCCRFLDETKLATASGDSTCRVWDINTANCLYYFEEHTGDVMSISPHPTNANLFISGSVDMKCKLWDVRTPGAAATVTQRRDPVSRSRFFMFDEDENQGTKIGSSFSFNDHASDVNSVTFFPDGYAFGSGSDDSRCRLWDLRSYQRLNVFKSANTVSGVTSVEFSKSGRLLFAGYDDHGLRGWDVLKNPTDEEDTDPVVDWKRHEMRVSSISVNSTGSALATASWDTFIRIHA